MRSTVLNRAIALSLAIGATSACSSGGVGTGTGGTSSLGVGSANGNAGDECAEACASVVGAVCPVYPNISQCVADCEAYANSCGAPYTPYLQCATNAQVECDASGAGRIVGCDNEIAPVAPCLVCVEVPGENSCASCQRINCCEDMKYFVSTADYLPFIRCTGKCTSDACFDACENLYPMMKPRVDALESCMTMNCVTSCTS
jgi:hypothetical protein